MPLRAPPPIAAKVNLAQGVSGRLRLHREPTDRLDGFGGPAAVQDGSIEFVRLPACIGPHASAHPADFSAFDGKPAVGSGASSRPKMTHMRVRQESWQRIGGASPPRGRSSQPPRPRVMHEVLLARAAVKRSQGRPWAEY